MKIGLIGCGRMGGAILEGAVAKGLIAPENLWLSSRTKESAEALAAKCGGHVAENHAQVLKECDLVLLGCKPYQLLDVIASLGHSLPGDTVLVSVAAGVTLTSMAKVAPPETRLIRAMPNTPCMIGKGATGIATGEFATDRDMEVTKALFQAVGIALRVSESQLDAVTGLSGSGPAFVYQYAASLAAQATDEGLGCEDALTLATQTILGAAEMLRQTGQSPTELINQVTSPGGTTLAGLEAMAEEGFDHAARAAVQHAAARSREISKEM